LFFVFYSFTIIDVAKKITFGEFYLSNATNFVQFLLTLIGVFFAYYKLRTYIRDSKVKSKMLEQDLIKKERENFNYSWGKEFIKPFENESTYKI
jgi:predicted membrane protein